MCSKDCLPFLCSKIKNNLSASLSGIIRMMKRFGHKNLIEHIGRDNFEEEENANKEAVINDTTKFSNFSKRNAASKHTFLCIYLDKF